MKFLTFKILFLYSAILFGQEIDFSPSVNFGSNNNFSGTIDGREQNIIFLADYTDDGYPWYFYSTRQGKWSNPEQLPKSVSPNNLIYHFGHNLNFEGDVFYYTSRKSGMGGYDLWYSVKKDDGWSYGRSIGVPINSSSNEGSPSVTADGRTLYFMRCDEMTMNTERGCKIYTANRIGEDRWTEPEPLPELINGKNAISPQILHDSKTLIFASDERGGSGGYDLFKTVYNNGVWSSPKNITYLNSIEDEKYVDMSMIGATSVIARKGATGRNKIMKVRIPDVDQPPAVLVISGKVNEVNRSRFILYSENEKREIINELMEDETFKLVLPKNGKYELIVLPAQVKKRIISKVYDTDQLIRTRSISEAYDIADPKLNQNLKIENLKYSTTYPELSDNYDILLMLSRHMKANPQYKFNFELVQTNYMEDSLKSNPDLTELKIDSIESKSYILMESDTINISENKMDTLNTSLADSITSIVSIDSLVDRVDTVWTVSYDVKFTYHNDRSEKESILLKDYLLEQGIPEERFEIRAVRKEEQEGETSNRYITITYK